MCIYHNGVLLEHPRSHPRTRLLRHHRQVQGAQQKRPQLEEGGEQECYAYASCKIRCLNHRRHPPRRGTKTVARDQITILTQAR